MRQILLIVAILGAVLSGWVPAVAATLNIAQPAGMHAMHQMAKESGDSEHGDKSKPAAHPVACSACFAIEVSGLGPVRQALDVSSHTSTAVPQLIGLALPPVDPPPRS